MVKINSNGEVLCPKCGGNFLHQSSINATFRDSEDGPGTSVLSNKRGVHIERSKTDKIFGRRDVVEIDFWCESCGKENVLPPLIIYQHKGRTHMEWLTPPPSLW
ncbi:MAG: hypothetical protein H8D37_05815 [Chloroflexi bacterium]|nr:hypothetical protein [Chloroflexota bacterium]